jgi:kynurenine formamidase
MGYSKQVLPDMTSMWIACATAATVVRRPVSVHRMSLHQGKEVLECVCTFDDVSVDDAVAVVPG